MRTETVLTTMPVGFGDYQAPYRACEAVAVTNRNTSYYVLVSSSVGLPCVSLLLALSHVPALSVPTGFPSVDVEFAKLSLLCSIFASIVHRT